SLLKSESEGLAQGAALPGAVAFKLYDTYGFPLDLTQDALREEGKSVDVDGFNEAMAEQKARARAAWAGSGDAATETIWFELNETLGGTEFLGYSTETAEGSITALVVDGQPTDEALPEQTAYILLNQTPFYAESGGQVGDTGIITGPDNLRIRITDTQKKLGALYVHIGVVEAGTARVGQAVVASVDQERRGAIRAHHSATHLLHEALRRALGPHVTQKGSLNAPDRLRFDISQPRPITAEELAQVEREVNAHIRENAEVTTRLMTPDEAVKLGAMALFGEKYGDEVRVVSMGGPAEGKSAWSIELCGGTHVARTGDIGLFRIVSEGAVSAGIRRIEALAGEAAIAAIEAESKLLAEAAASIKAPPAELPGRIAQLQDDKKRLERQVAELQKKLVLATASEAEEINGVKAILRNVGDVAAKELRPIATDLLKGLGSGVVALVSTAEQKTAIVVAVSDDLPQSAVELVRAAATAASGQGGGGNKAVAQAGAPNAAQANAALAAIKSALAG
ncbi:MAG: alanine--tRNA ligase, partial [Rhodospirillales bacterium]|nr:alanine--tRNA ligase [Rhodospirillales bacterium]